MFHQSYVNGEWKENKADKIDVNNPADGSIVGQVDNSNVTTMKEAIDAAHLAFPIWKRKTAKDRSIILMKWFDLIMENKEAIAHIMALESGKPLEECKGEIGYGASFIQWFAEQAKRNNGTVIPGFTEDRRISVIR